MTADSKNIFSSATSYEGYVGRWSDPVAREFIQWLNVPPGQEWLDMGAGTGILTQIILQQASPTKIVGIDLSPDYIDFARQRVTDDRAEFRVGDAVNTAFESPEFDVAVSGLVLNFLPDYNKAAHNMAQAVRAGGRVGAYVWDYGGKMEMMRHFWDAAIKVDPAAREQDSGQRFTICNPDNLRALWESVGLTAVESRSIDVPTRFTNFDDYWLPFLDAQGSVAKYLRGLNAETLAAIREQLRQQLPTAADGSIPLVARAWAVKGQKPV